MSRVVEAFAADCARADKPNTARRLGARAILPGCGRVGVFAVLLSILLTTFSTHPAQAQANLMIMKSVSNPTPNVGDMITFTVTLTNSGSSNATNVQVTDQLPSGLTFVSSTPSQGTYNSTTGVWTVGTVDTVNPQTLQLLATVATASPKTNTATVTAADPPTPTGASANVTVTPQVADLSIAKTVSNSTPNVGDTIVFTVSLSNSGPNAATNVTAQDQLPAGLTLVSSSPSQGTYNPAPPGTWTVGTVAAGATATLTLTATVVSPSPQTNTATITHSDQFDPTANNSASASVAPQVADLAVTKTAPPSAHVNDTFNEVVKFGTERRDQRPSVRHSARRPDVR
jgi:uncharacterized repeat protein (TIGR01451 family)